MNNLTELHESLARVVLGNRELVEVLTEITGIARRAMPSIEAASVTLIRGEKPFTAAYDGQMALDADELQYERGYGPCMDAGGPARCSSSTTCGPNNAGPTTPNTPPRTVCSARSPSRYRSKARPSARSTPTPDARISRRQRY